MAPPKVLLISENEGRMSKKTAMQNLDGSENPYAKGGERADWNPRNGQLKPTQQCFTQHRNVNHFQSQHSQSQQFSNHHQYSAPARGGYGRGGMRGGRSGYRGPPELFDPNFAEKKAAAAAKSKTVAP